MREKTAGHTVEPKFDNSINMSIAIVTAIAIILCLKYTCAHISFGLQYVSESDVVHDNGEDLTENKILRSRKFLLPAKSSCSTSERV